MNFQSGSMKTKNLHWFLPCAISNQKSLITFSRKFWCPKFSLPFGFGACRHSNPISINFYLLLLLMWFLLSLFPRQENKAEPHQFVSAQQVLFAFFFFSFWRVWAESRCSLNWSWILFRLCNDLYDLIIENFHVVLSLWSCPGNAHASGEECKACTINLGQHAERCFLVMRGLEKLYLKSIKTHDFLFPCF